MSVSLRLRRLWLVVAGHRRWLEVLVALGVMVVADALAKLAFTDLPWWAVVASLASGLPALLLPWRWVGTLAVLGVVGTQCVAVVLAGDAARPWLLPMAAAALALVVAVEPLERSGEADPPQRLAALPRWDRLGLPGVALIATGGVGWAAAADTRPSGGLVVVGLIGACSALAVVLRAHR
jgi:hypothetical protein